MPTPSIQTLVTDAQQVLNLDSISAVRSVVAVALANANTGTPLNPNLTTQQLWNEFYQVVTKPKSDIESIIANQLMKFLFAPPAPGGVGANGQVIFNDGGVLAGDPQFLWNKTTNLLTVTGSATITGDLTVDTSTLKVDSGTNNVSIGGLVNKVTGVSGSGTGLTIQASAGPTLGIWDTTDPSYFTNLAQVDANCYLYNNAAGALLFGVGNVEAMRLNSTGLGVGVTPSAKFDVGLTGAGTPRIQFTSASDNPIYQTQRYSGVGSNYFGERLITGGGFYFQSAPAAVVGSQTFTTNMALDASGNLGIGVTPNTWTSYKALQVQGASIFSTTGNDTAYGSNFYYDGAYRFRSASSDKACMYSQFAGQHQWHYTASAGTAGNVATFTQAMTLDASGNLLVKKTASGGTTLGVELLATGQINGAAANADNLNIYNTTAAAYRFYVSAAGTVFATNTTISAISDARFKENVQDIDVGLGAILALKPRKFDWKYGKGKNIKGDRGFIAQEFEQVFPNLIDEWKENAPEGEAPYKSVRQDLIPVLVKAIQELAAEVNALKNA